MHLHTHKTLQSLHSTCMQCTQVTIILYKNYTIVCVCVCVLTSPQMSIYPYIVLRSLCVRVCDFGDEWQNVCVGINSAQMLQITT